MLSDFTIGVLKFSTFCLFVEAAIIIFKEQIREEIENCLISY